MGGKDYEHCTAKKLALFANLNDRIILYTGLKALIRKNIAITIRGDLDVTTALAKELNDLLLAISNLIKIRSRMERGNGLIANVPPCITYLGNYSKAVSIQTDALLKVKDRFYISETPTNVLRLLEELRKENPNRKFDLIITDPPYGYNTQEDVYKFSKMYRKMIEGLIQVLNDFGQLIICLPEYSYTGRQVPYFAQRQLIIHQIFYFAHQNRMEVIHPFKLLPKPTGLFSPPYFWQSEKALKRSILHFMFKRHD